MKNICHWNSHEKEKKEEEKKSMNKPKYKSLDCITQIVIIAILIRAESLLFQYVREYYSARK